jgi:hypothetical protein
MPKKKNKEEWYYCPLAIVTTDRQVPRGGQECVQGTFKKESHFISHQRQFPEHANIARQYLADLKRETPVNANVNGDTPVKRDRDRDGGRGDYKRERGGDRDSATARQRETARDRETARQRDRERQRDSETERQKRQRDSETARQRDSETARQRDRETERQRDRETERQRNSEIAR